jgi:rhodanese-related sulfurtransferase
VSRFLGDFQAFARGRLADLRDAVRARLGSLEGVTAEELAARLEDPGTIVVDVRPAADHAAGHVPGAISVPMEELRGRLDELPAGARIVAYCGGPYCVVSPEAVRLLREHGFDARPLDGGFLGWRRGAAENGWHIE